MFSKFIPVITVLLIIFLFYVFSLFNIIENKQDLNNYISKTVVENEQKINNELYGYMHNILEEYSVLNILPLFYQREDASTEFLTSLRLYLINSTRTKTDFTDIVLYRVSDSAVVSLARSGHNLINYTSVSYEDINEIRKLNNITAPRFVFTSDSKMVYVYPVLQKNRSIEDAYLGFVALYINKDTLFTSGVKNFNNEGAFAFIYKDTIFSIEGNNILSDEIIINTAKNYENGQIIEQSFNSSKYIFSVYSETLTYLYYAPYTTVYGSLLSSDSSIKTAFIIAALLVLFAGGALYYILLNKKKLEPSSSFSYMMELLYGNSNDLSKTVQKLFNTYSVEKFFSVIIINPMEKTEILKTIERYFKESKINYACIAYPKSFYTCVVNSFFLDKVSQGLLAELKKDFSGEYNLFYTTPSELSDLQNNYIYISSMLKYSFIYGYSNIFSQEKLEMLEASQGNPDMISDTRISNYLIDLKFDELKNYIKSNILGHSYDYSVNFLKHIYQMFQNQFKENSIIIPETNINNFPTADDFINFIFEQLNKYKNEIGSINDKYTSSITAYIIENIETVTLASVSEKFNISTAHLSRTFKECMNINFSDYVLEKKLQKAAKLIEAGKVLSVEDLAKNLGYSTPAYFSKKFKDHFGLTPAMYKKKVALDT